MDAQKSYQLGARPAWQKHADHLRQHDPVDRDPLDRSDAVGEREKLHGSRFAAIPRCISRGGRDAERDRDSVSHGQRRICATLHMDYLRPVDGIGSRGRPASCERFARHRRIPGEYRRDADDGEVRSRGGAGSASHSNRCSWIICRACIRVAKPALSWAEIVRANEATLAAHTAAGLHRFVAISARAIRRVRRAYGRLEWYNRGSSERWQSGRSHPPRKRAYLNGYREFESPPLRQPSKTTHHALLKLVRRV